MAKQAKSVKQVKKVEVKVEEGPEPMTPQTENELHLDRDANDPRLKPPVDGNTQPNVDINIPA